jgi:hypothetical protein
MIAGIIWYVRKPSDDTRGGSAKIEQVADKMTTDNKDAEKKEAEKKSEESGGRIVSNDDPKTKPQPEPKPEPKPELKPQPTPDPKSNPEPKPEPKPDSTIPKTWIVDAQKGAGADDAEIEPVLQKAKDGDSITLKPGTYAGGFTVDKKIRIAGEKAEPAKYVIHTNTEQQRKAVRIVAQGVTLANLQILQGDGGAGPALIAAKECNLTLESCELKFRSATGILGQSPASFTASNCSFSSEAGRAMVMRGPTKIEMTKCSFTGGAGAFNSDIEAQYILRGCNFSDLGDKAAKAAALSIFGEGASITAEDCTFTRCRLPLQAEMNATLSLTKCTFTGNGVSGENGDFTQGIIAVSKKAGATLKDVTFEKNRQGINVFGEASVQLEDCKFSESGVMSKDGNFMLFSVPLRAHGEGTKATIRHSTFTRSKSHAIFITKGASVSLEDSDFTGTMLGAVSADKSSGAQCDVRVKKCRFSGNTEGITLAGATAMVDDCEFRENSGGLSARGASTKADINGGTIEGQKDFGFLSTSDAVLTLTSVKFEGNLHGVQVGVPGKAGEKATANLEECKFLGSTDADVLACAQSKVTLRLCDFDPDGGPKVKREKGAQIQSEPPLLGIMDLGGKGGSTASNTKGVSSSKGRTTSPPSRSRPSGDSVRDIINTVERVRRMFR